MDVSGHGILAFGAGVIVRVANRLLVVLTFEVGHGGRARRGGGGGGFVCDGSDGVVRAGGGGGGSGGSGSGCTTTLFSVGRLLFLVHNDVHGWLG